MSTLPRCAHALLKSSCVSMILSLLVPSLYPDVKLSAQPIGPDLRIFDGITHGWLDDSIRIGSAALVDSSILAVWGNRRTLVDGAVVPALYVGGESATTRVLTDPEARPHRMITVVSLGSAALVLWNDARQPGNGIYASVLDRYGERIRPDTLLVPGGALNRQAFGFTSGERTLVLLSQTKDGTDAIDGFYFNHVGELLSGPVRLRNGAFPLQAPTQIPLLDGGTFLYVQGDEPLVVLPDGDVYPYRLPADRLTRPFVFDGSVGVVTTLPGNRLARFDSLHHDEPSWVVSDMKGSAIGRDDRGWFTAGFDGEARRHLPSDLQYWYIFVLARHYADTITGTHSHVEYDTLHVPGPPNGANSVAMNGPTNVRTTMLADGRMRVSGSWTLVYNPHGPPDRVELSGGLQRDYYSHADSAVPRRATVTASVWGTRDSSGLKVTVTESGRIRTATYGVETPPAGEPASTDRPVLWCDDQRVYAGAVSDRGWLGSISRDVADPSQMRSYPLIYDAEDLTGGYVRGWNVSGFYTRTRTVEILNPYFPRYTTTIDHYWWHIDTGGWVRRRIQHLTKDRPESAAEAYFPSAAYDPNLNEWLWHTSFTESEGGSWSTPVSIVNFVNTRTGAERVFSSSRYVLPRGIILPIDSHHICHLAEDYEFRLFGPGTVWNADGTTNPYIKSGIDDNVDNVSLQRLFGSTFLTTTIDHANQRLSLSVRSLERIVPGHADLPLDADTEELPFVLQHPRDSVLIVVRNGTSGPVISLFGPMCERLYDGKGNETGMIPASTGGYPSRDVVAALAGDTLWVAWTDDRSGEPQAYMNGVRLPSVRSRQVEPDLPDSLSDSTRQELLFNNPSANDRLERFGFAIFAVSPNPAWRHADVVIGSDSVRTLLLVQYDALGRRLGRVRIEASPGLHRYALPDVYERTGVYYVEVSAADHRETVGHIVFPN